MKVIDGIHYYSTKEVCKKIGIGRTTFWRWYKAGRIPSCQASDRNGWPLWTEDEIIQLNDVFNVVVTIQSP